MFVALLLEMVIFCVCVHVQVLVSCHLLIFLYGEMGKNSINTFADYI